MRLAVTYENGNISEDFENAKQVKLYKIVDRKIMASHVFDVAGEGFKAVAELLSANRTDALICGQIGNEAVEELAHRGIYLFGGAKGTADGAADALIDETLEYDTTIRYEKPEQEGQSCGLHGCAGCSGCH